MDILRSYLSSEPFLVLDGAFGTEISRRGVDTSDALWSARALYENPALIVALHEDYYRKGADIATCASYQATVEGFQNKGFSHEEAKRLIRRSVELAKEARDQVALEIPHGTRPYPLVAASVGPYGAFLANGSEYTGDYGLPEKALQEFHAERLPLLISAKPDILACETLPILTEARAITKELKKYPNIGAWFSFSCKNGRETTGGDVISDCARFLDANPQVLAIGVNCTAPEYISPLIRSLRHATSKPIVVYPNSGETYDVQTKNWHGVARPFASYAKEWWEEGARLIGGCCRTTPDDIAAIAHVRQSLKRTQAL